MNSRDSVLSPRPGPNTSRAVQRRGSTLARLFLVLGFPLLAMIVVWHSVAEPALYSQFDYEGRQELLRGRPADALARFQCLIRLDSSRYLGYWDCALAEEQLGLDKQAIAHYGVTLKILSTAAGVAEIRSALGRQRAFSERFRVMRASIYYERARLEDQIDRPVDAERDCSASLAILPDTDVVRWLRARQYLRTHQTERALRDAGLLIEHRPMDPDRYSLRADIYEDAGRRDLAGADRRRAGRLIAGAARPAEAPRFFSR